MPELKSNATFVRSVTLASNKGQQKQRSFGATNAFNEVALESLDQRRIRNKAATSQLLDWYVGEWATWQKHGFLCGLAKRCSKAQTNYLLSALEPVFHRDYMLQVDGIYPWRHIGKGRKPLKLKKVTGNRYKRTKLLHIAKQRLKMKPDHLKNGPPGGTFGQTSKPNLSKQSTKEKLQKDSSSLSRTVTNSDLDETPRNPPTTVVPTGRNKRWLTLKTVQMLDSNTLLGDRDRGLAIREMMVDGLGVWNASHVRRRVPLMGASADMSLHHKHFLLKSAAAANTAISRRNDMEREYTKSSISFRTENMYTPGGGLEKGLPRTREELQKVKTEYKTQLRTIYQWMKTMTEVELGETLSNIVLSATNPDLRFLTSCLIQRENDSFDINQLTDSLLLSIFQLLGPEDLKSASQVSFRWSYLANMDALWANHCQKLGKLCGLETIEELADTFLLGESLANESPSLPQPIEISLSAIDWKCAYEEISAAIAEASNQIREEENQQLQILYPTEYLTNDDKTSRSQSPSLIDSIRRMMPVLQSMSEEDKWMERENWHREAHLLLLSEDREMIALGGREEQEREPSPSLSDMYDIQSLMMKRHRWKISLPSRDGDSRQPSPGGTESIFNALGLETGQVQSSSNRSDYFGKDKNGLKLYKTSRVEEYDDASEYSLPSDGFLTAAQIREASLFSFERKEFEAYQEQKAKEALEALKKKRNQLEKMANRVDQKKQKIKREKAKNQKKRRRVNRDDEISTEAHTLSEDVKAELARSIHMKSMYSKSASRRAGEVSELLHRAANYLGTPVAPSVIQEEDGVDGEDSTPSAKSVQDFVEEVAVDTVNLDVPHTPTFADRLGHRSEGELERALAGNQVGLDVRPPVLKPPEILLDISRHYDVQWRYPKRVNPFKGARYQNRILAVKCLKILHGHMDGVLCMKMLSGRLMSGSSDHSLRVWGAGSGRSLHKMYGHKGSVSCLDFDEEWIATGSWDMTIMLWDSKNYKYHKTLFGHLGKISALVLRKHFLFSASHDSSIRMWHIDQNFSCAKIFRTPSPLTSLIVLPKPEIKEPFLVVADEDTKLPEECVFGSFDGAIRILDLKREKTHQLTGHTSEVACIKITGNLIISGSADGQVRFWNKHSLACESGIQAHEQAVLSLDFHRRKFYTGSADSSIREWDLYTMTCMRVLHGHKGPVRSLRVSDKRIVSCSDDGDIRYWDLYDPLEKELMN